jgi:hypothetical protein
MIEGAMRGENVKKRSYYQKFVPSVDWEWMLVVGVLIGSFLAAILSGEFKVEWVPTTWSSAFGTAVSVRWVAALFGGIILGIGARWAGGCTSGHGISGTLQLVVGSWVAAVCFFVGGIITAIIVY